MKRIVSLLIIITLTLTVLPLSLAEENVYEADIIIVGAGGAGMVAAIEATNAGASVIILEKRQYAGGSTMRASGGIDAAGTQLQRDAGIEDSGEQFAKDIIRQGKTNDPVLVEYLASHGEETIEFAKSIGFEFSPKIQIQYNDPPRSHRDAYNRSVGLVLVPLLLKQMEERNVTILYNTTATAFIKEESGEVTGVKAVDANGVEMIFKGGAIIDAAGGFAGSQELIAKYVPQYIGYPTAGEITNTGDGMIMAEAIGAKLDNMEYVSTSALEYNTLYSPGVTMTRNGMIRFNAKGEHVQNGKPNEEVIYGVYNAITEANSPTAAVFTSSGSAIIADTIRELAEKLDIDPDIMEKSLNEYNEDYLSEEKIDRVTGSKITALVNIGESGPYYAIRLINGTHYTCGGIVINVNTEVIDTEGNVMPGFYAAGEVTTGVHGQVRYTGNSITDVLTFGRVAGTNAAAYALAKGHVEASTLPVSIANEVPAANYKDGEYTASANGLNGLITLNATFENGQLVKIETVESPETPSLYSAIERNIFPEFISNQSADNIDTITGATYARNAVLTIMEDIFSQAAQ